MNITPKKLMVLPFPSWNNKDACSIIFSKFLHRFYRFDNIKWYYTEPSYNLEHGNCWLVEFCCQLHNSRSQLNDFMSTFKLEVSKFVKLTSLTVNYNLRDRISVFIFNDDWNENVITKEKEKKNRRGKGSMKKQREKWIQTMETIFNTNKIIDDNIIAVCNPSTDQSTSVVKSNLREEFYDVSISSKGAHVTSSEQLAFCENTPEVCSDTASKSVVVDQSRRVDAIRNVMPAHSIIKTQQSRSYAKLFLKDKHLFESVRTYIAYLEQKDSSVIINGESKVSLGMKLKSEGLPLGEELRSLYYEYCEDNDVSLEDIRADLDAYSSYCSTLQLQSVHKATMQCCCPCSRLKDGNVATPTSSLQSSANVASTSAALQFDTN